MHGRAVQSSWEGGMPFLLDCDYKLTGFRAFQALLIPMFKYHKYSHPNIFLKNHFKINFQLRMTVHAFSSSIWEAEAGESVCEFRASLVYRASSQAARATQTLSRKKKKKKTEKEKNYFLYTFYDYVKYNSFKST